MAQKSLSKLYPKIEGDSKFGFNKISFIKTDTVPANAVEGQIYYDDSENKLKLYNGTSWDALDTAAAAAGTGLDGSYDINNSITVDGSAVTLVAGATSDTMQISSSYATGSDAALLDLVWTGTPNAGGNMLRVDASAVTATNAPYVIEIAADAKDVSALYVDSDPATNHQVYLHTEGVTGASKSQLYIDCDGEINATGTLLTLDATGMTATNTPNVMFINAGGIDSTALYIDADAATDSTVVIHNDGNAGAGKALLHIDIDGTPNATGYGLYVDATGATATNTPIAVKIASNGIDMAAMDIDTDAATDDGVKINGGGAVADNKAVLAVYADGTPAASGSNIVRIDASGITATNAPTCLEINSGGKDTTALWIDADSATGHTIYVNNDGALAAGKSMLYLDYNGTANATGTLLQLDATGATMTNTPYAMKIDVAGKDGGAIYIDSDAVTDHVVQIQCGGAIADNKALLALTWDGTPAAAGSNMLRVDGSGGTNTNKPVLVEIYDDSVAVGLSVDTASIEDVVSITGSGNTGANKSVVDINWGAVTPNAAGNLLRLDATAATTTSVPIMFEIVGAGEVARAIYSDVDCTSNHANLFHCGGALTNGYGVVGITNDGNLAAGGNLLNITMGGTPADATVCALEVVAAKNCLALDIASSAVDAHAVQVTGSGATADNKALLNLAWGAVTPAAAGSNILRVDGSAITATNVPTLVEIIGGGKTVQGLNIDADCTTVPVVLINGGGALADNQGVLNLTNDGNLATGGNLLNVTMGGTPHTAAAAVEIVASKDAKALDITTSAATNSAVKITGVGAVADDMGLLHVSHGTGAIAAGGSLVRIEGNANAAGATAYGMTINCNATNLEALWVEAGTSLFAEAVTMSSTLAVTGAATFTAGQQSLAVARTATADGTGTGTIAAGTTYVTVTAGADANSIIVLPAPVVGNVIWLYIGATGYELRSSDPATIAINGGSGAGAESAIAANTLVRMVCTSATTWIGSQFNSAGTESAVQVAAA